MSADRVHFDFTGVAQLVDTQGTYRARFDGVLGDIKATVNTLLGQWYGIGTPEYTAKQKLFETQYTDLQTAFANLQAQTDQAHQHFTRAGQQIVNVWT
jgi:WXG100 family type VII secretion target